MLKYTCRYIYTTKFNIERDHSWTLKFYYLYYQTVFKRPSNCYEKKKKKKSLAQIWPMTTTNLKEFPGKVQKVAAHNYQQAKHMQLLCSGEVSLLMWTQEVLCQRSSVQ